MNPPVIIEEFLPGREFTVGVLEDMGELKALEVTEITSPRKVALILEQKKLWKINGIKKQLQQILMKN